MDPKTTGLIAAVAGLATMGTAHAASLSPANVADALHADSYADLLAPVENAEALVQADDAARLQTVQYYNGYYYGNGYNGYYHHHHHHHHANYYRRYEHHHHHHSNYYGRNYYGRGYYGR